MDEKIYEYLPEFFYIWHFIATSSIVQFHKFFLSSFNNHDKVEQFLIHSLDSDMNVSINFVF